MTQKIKSISIVVPLYNEENRIQKTLPIIEEKLRKIEKKLNIKGEILLIDDGSKDNTYHTIKTISKYKKTKIYKEEINRGKGHALKVGFKNATGDYIIFMDADLSTPLKHINDFIKNIENTNTILIGSRKKKGSNVKKHQPWVREKLGQGFTFLSNVLLVWGISDFTCGFKMFPRTAGKKIFGKVTINRWGFDSEILYLAKKYGYKIKEIPVEWTNSDKTRVDLKKDIFRSLMDIFKIKLNSLTGRY